MIALLLLMMPLVNLGVATDKLDNRQRQFTAYSCSQPFDKVAFEAGGVRECTKDAEPRRQENVTKIALQKVDYLRYSLRSWRGAGVHPGS